MNQGVIIVHRGYKIKPVKGGWVIEGFEGTTFVTPDAAKQHIQMVERAIPGEQPKVVFVNGKPCEVSHCMSVGLRSDGTYGFSMQFKPLK